MNFQIKGPNKECPYYPCHEGLEDCTFCYCPFYPCGDTRLGEYIKTKEGKTIFSCKKCNWIHKKETVEKIYKYLSKIGKEEIEKSF